MPNGNGQDGQTILLLTALGAGAIAFAFLSGTRRAPVTPGPGAPPDTITVIIPTPAPITLGPAPQIITDPKIVAQIVASGTPPIQKFIDVPAILQQANKPFTHSVRDGRNVIITDNGQTVIWESPTGHSIWAAPDASWQLISLGTPSALGGNLEQALAANAAGLDPISGIPFEQLPTLGDLASQFSITDPSQVPSAAELIASGLPPSLVESTQQALDRQAQAAQTGMSPGFDIGFQIPQIHRLRAGLVSIPQLRIALVRQTVRIR